MEGVTFIVPVHNGEPWLAAALASIDAQRANRPTEIIVVDDGSRDESVSIAEAFARGRDDVRVIRLEGFGAASAINTGVRAAAFPIVCQIDQDVVLSAGWLDAVLAELRDPAVAAAQGCYVVDRAASTFARVMALDLELRYHDMRTRETGHVCTGNAAYRAAALRRVGLFDERLGYGYDNDMSYRLREAGYRLRFCPDAQSFHRWREGLAGYAVQQYGFGYGRIDLVAKHPRRATGDSVSPALMMAHPLLTFFAILALAIAAVAAALDGSSFVALVVAAAIVGALATERLIAGVRAAVRFRDPAGLLFPVVHLVRDVSWVCAIAIWAARHVRGGATAPRHSMRPRRVSR